MSECLEGMLLEVFENILLSAIANCYIANFMQLLNSQAEIQIV